MPEPRLRTIAHKLHSFHPLLFKINIKPSKVTILCEMKKRNIFDPHLIE